MPMKRPLKEWKNFVYSKKKRPRYVDQYKQQVLNAVQKEGAVERCEIVVTDKNKLDEYLYEGEGNTGHPDSKKVRFVSLILPFRGLTDLI